MKLLFNLLLLAITIPCFAQKKLVDNETPKNWEKLESYQISDNGKFVWYKQVSPSYGLKVVLKSTDGKFERVFDNVSTPTFTIQAKYFIYSYPRKDSITVLDLTSKREILVKGHVYKTFSSMKGDLIACKSESQLTLMNLKSKKSRIYKNVRQFEFSPDGSLLIIAKFGEQNSLILINGTTNGEQIISKNIAGGWTTDLSGQKLAYLTNDSLGNKLWLYNFLTKINRMLSIDDPYGDVKITDGAPKISADGKMLYFEIERTIPDLGSNILTDQLKVWHYGDGYPKSVLKDKNPEALGERQLVVYNISSSELIPIADASLKLVNGGKFPNRYMLFTNNMEERDVLYQSKNRQLLLLDLETGDRKQIASNPSPNISVEITRDEKFIIWYDIKRHKYYSYETKTGLKHDLSSSIPYPMDDLNDLKKMRPEKDLIVYGCNLQPISSKSDNLIISDEFDLWQVDPSGNVDPVCLTKKVGRTKGMRFTVVPSYDDEGKRIISDTILIAGFNMVTKENGIFSLELGTNKGIKTVVPMQAKLFYGAGAMSYRPQKASNAGFYLVVHQNANKSPNLYVHDKSGNVKISNIYPEAEFNWYTTELHNYKLADGTNNQGILYKPENFDPAKKYPVIFYYYEIMTWGLNNFIAPIQSQCELTIPWYVSNGYLVFVPDVTHQRPNPGDRIYDCITSAANHVSALPYVDAKHMGLQGHSYGGYETNLMITRSSLFAAAQSSAGLSNLTSYYGTPTFGGYPGSNLAENGQLNMPGKLWEYKELYIKDSPVFHVDKVSTPLLMLHGTKDGQVPFAQSAEMYFALRRLNKPVWLLEYEDEAHYLENDKNIQDFALRQQQFFDHYLKGKPMPFWMSRGVPSWERGIKSGLELDTLQTSK